MKLIFFDESKNDAKYKHYHLGAVCIDEEKLAGIDAALNALALDMLESLKRDGIAFSLRTNTRSGPQVEPTVP